MRTKEQYRQVSNYYIALEILSDPDATIREQVIARRIHGMHGGDTDNRHYAEHKFD